VDGQILMARTPKIVRRNRGSCICPDSAQHLKDKEFTTGTCRYRHCVVLRCRACHGQLVSWGPVGCRCDGGPRWARHPGMDTPGHWDEAIGKFVRVHAAVKPSIARQRSAPKRKKA
jgi:hypothetical protein